MPVTIGIHPSVARIVPPERLESELADAASDATVRVLDGRGDGRGGRDATVDPASVGNSLDVVASFGFEEWFLDAGLDWIHVVRAGHDEFPVDALRERGIALTNSSGIHGAPVGETVLGYMLQFAHGLHRYRDDQLDREWNPRPWGESFTLEGERVCVVGLGTLGRGIARRADAVGMSVVGVRRTPAPVDHVAERYSPENLREAVSDARFVVLAVPLNPATEGLFGAAELAAMREDAYLVNVARGPVADQSAVVDALESDAIAGAALDVTDPEPLPAESPLWGMENVVVTPHASAADEAFPERVADIVGENVRRLRDGESLANQVV
ncbi:D-2-hydroxyacid dehydrogenase [Halogeometricum luteum]|uniref:D-2-hydroxyacid dehydrogenase n=1 Tax=Halogeometricum luteum TaxID=2950537 RepID=A0ABU2G190_9EURY|nr:D-2-hydroxyacid dehydrogenase [Halogeometricum sp. S3BR5-2]MDS0294555.1 D-2-hydroxyacid dehydrogenase [Halogeometricum sp. S3BR5-2]